MVRVAHLNCDGDVENGSITVDGELACPLAQHPKCVAAGSCQGSCLGEGFYSDGHGLLYGPGGALGLPIHCGKTVQLDGVTSGIGMVVNKGGSSQMFFVSVL